MRVLQKITFIILLSIPLFSQAQKIDEVYNQKIKEYTTDTRFLPASVLNLMDDPNVPSPRKYFGEIIGAPGIMHRTSEIYGYYKKLSETSPYIKIEQIGITEEGRPIQLVIVGNDETMKRLDYYKKQISLLSDPRKIGPQDINSIIKDSKPIYYLQAGLHSPEMGSPETTMELVYRLITDPSPEIKKVLDNVIVLLNPVAEPDGRDKQVDWYYRYTKSRKEFDESDFPFSPPYWGKYIFHDNNRDGIQNSQQLTKAIYKLYYDWHPTIMHDLHESVALIYMSTGTGPYNETMDPITIGEWQVFANHDVTTLASQGLPGAFTWAFYDGWYPGYAAWIANNHNGMGRFYETFGNAGANTYIRDLSEESYAGDSVTSRQWYRPDPATKKVNWSSRNNVNYTEAAVLASLSYAADNRKLLLQNFYQKGVNSIKKGKDSKPKAFVIAKAQHDPFMAAYLVNQIRVQGIEVHQSGSGDYVILMDQPYRNLAISLLSKQNYPKEAKFPPYDDISWTMGQLYGVDVKTEDSLKYNLSDLKLVKDDVRYEGKLEGDGGTYILNYKAQNTAISALYWLKAKNAKVKTSVLELKSVFSGIKDTLSAGSIFLSGITSDQAKTISSQFGLDLIESKSIPNAKLHDINLPRVAIYHNWYYTQDEGWSRFTFEQRGIPYTSIDKDDLKSGGLRSKFDVILLPRTYGTAADFTFEIDKSFGPMPYTKTAEYPSHGFPDATNDMTGGPGLDGVAQLKQFVDAGGVLITLDNTSQIMSDIGIIRNLEKVGTPGLFHPGSVVTAKVRKIDHPVLYGFPEITYVFKGNSPLLKTKKTERGMILLQYGTTALKDEAEYKGPIMGLPDAKLSTVVIAKTKDAPYVLSGMVRNEQMIIGHGSIFNVPVGAGRVIAFTFDPLHRFLNLHEAPMVWNALMHWDHLK